MTCEDCAGYAAAADSLDMDNSDLIDKVYALEDELATERARIERLRTLIYDAAEGDNELDAEWKKAARAELKVGY